MAALPGDPGKCAEAAAALALSQMIMAEDKARSAWQAAQRLFKCTVIACIAHDPEKWQVGLAETHHHAIAARDGKCSNSAR